VKPPPDDTKHHEEGVVTKLLPVVVGLTGAGYLAWRAGLLQVAAAFLAGAATAWWFTPATPVPTYEACLDGCAGRLVLYDRQEGICECAAQ
jgi:hypothetical protein